MELNPIIAREVRARWRHWPSFALLFGYTSLLAFVMVWHYSDSLSYMTMSQVKPWQRMALLGPELFFALTWMQTLVWMLLAPALTATTIAGERERGLLESLQLSPLKPWQIAAGKLLSALLFILVMMLVTMPVAGICFLMGGVSPSEFGLTVLLHATTATTCAVIGLFCSAWSRRGMIALNAAFVFTAVWGIGSAIALGVAELLSMGAPVPKVSPVWPFVLNLFGQTNPIVAALALKDKSFAFPSPLLLGAPPWAICIAFQVLLSSALLWLATRALRKPFGEQYWVEARKVSRKARAAGTVAAGTVAAGSNAAGDAAAGNAAVVPGGGADSPSSPSRGARSRRELPFASLIHFANPVLQRETRGKFRLRQTSLVVNICVAALWLVVLCIYLRAMWWIIAEPDSPDSRSVIWWVVAFTGLIVVMIATSLMGAAAFTRERESGTFEGLMLSTLPSRDIIIGKLCAPLLACLVYSVPLWPLLLLCVGGLTYDPQANSISLTQVAGTLLIVGATAWCYTAVGLLFSWLCRRTQAAVGWTIATLLAVNIFAPMLILPLSFYSQWDRWGFLINPVVALSRVVDPSASAYARWPDAITGTLLSVLLLFGTGCVLLVILCALMQRRTRQDGFKP